MVAKVIDDDWSTGRPLPGLTSEMRDEVRALIRAEIEQSLIPLLEKQRQLEEQLARDAAPEHKQAAEARPIPAVVATPSATSVAVLPVSVVPSPAPVLPLASSSSPAMPWPPLAAPARAESKMSAQAEPTENGFQVPREIDGTRRQNLVGWMIGLAVVMAFAAIVAAAIVSQMGYKW